MIRNKFEAIRKFLQFNNNNGLGTRNDQQFNRLFKIRPFIKILKERFGSIPKKQYLAVDVQICPTKAKLYFKQYLPILILNIIKCYYLHLWVSS